MIMQLIVSKCVVARVLSMIKNFIIDCRQASDNHPYYWTIFVSCQLS